MGAKILHGKLGAYREQGLEGRNEFAFRFEGQKEPLFLKNGHRLTSHEVDGKILWSWVIQFVKRGWLDNHKLKPGSGLISNKRMFPTSTGWTGSGINRR